MISRRSTDMISFSRWLCVFLIGVLLPTLASAQDGKAVSGRDVILGITASALEAKTTVLKAPELKPPTVKLPEVFSKTNPDSVDDLKAIQDHVAKTVEAVSPAVVSVRVGAAFGSGVIVSKDGYVLTAGHVSGPPGRLV